MNCLADPIGRIITLTNSQTLPPELFSKDCTFFQTNGCSTLAGVLTVMERSPVNGEHKNYGVGILAAFDFSGRRPLVSDMPIPPGSARELDSLPITRALLLAQATGEEAG